MKKKEILAIIPARGGSKGIKRKNMIPLEGKPLIQYSIDAALNSRYITRVTVNSDDAEILEYASSKGVEVVKRPQNLAEDNTPMNAVLVDQLQKMKAQEKYIPDIIVLLQPTSPLRTSTHIDEALEKMLGCDCNAMVSVVEEPHLYSPYSVMKMNGDGFLEFFIEEGKCFTSRQDKPKFYARNGAAIYAVYTDIYLACGSLYGTKCIPYEMKEEESIDIDRPLDLYLAECMMEYKKRN